VTYWFIDETLSFVMNASSMFSTLRTRELDTIVNVLQFVLKVVCIKVDVWIEAFIGKVVMNMQGLVTCMRFCDKGW